MGERVELGSLSYNVFESQWLTQLGDGPTARLPEHRFFLVRLSIVNSGAAGAAVPTMTLIDDTGKSYSELTDGDRVPNWIGFLRDVKPGDSLQGQVVFDAPPARYKLRVSGDSERRQALVDIPLTFGSDTPEVPLPQPR
jgi:hypothetical protein